MIKSLKLVILFCLISCFLAAQTNFLAVYLGSSKTQHNYTITDKITLPNSAHCSQLPISQTIAIECTDEDLTTTLHREGYKNVATQVVNQELTHSIFVKIQFKSQRVHLLSKPSPAFFILYHSWKTDIS